MSDFLAETLIRTIEMNDSLLADLRGESDFRTGTLDAYLMLRHFLDADEATS